MFAQSLTLFTVLIGRVSKSTCIFVYAQGSHLHHSHQTFGHASITLGQSNTAVNLQALALLLISCSDSKHINTAYVLTTTVCASLELLYRGANVWLKEADVI